jgi:hypothetical protein
MPVPSITTRVSKYGEANWAQGQAQQAATQLLDQLRALIDNDLNSLGRDLQHAADVAWPHRVETNAAQRKAFGLQPDRPMA